MKWLAIPALGIGLYLGVAIEHKPANTRVVTVWDDQEVPNMNHGDVLNIKREASMDPDEDYLWCDQMGGVLDPRDKKVVICRDVDF